MFLLYVIVIRSLVVTNLTCNAPRGDLLLKNKLKIEIEIENCVPFQKSNYIQVVLKKTKKKYLLYCHLKFVIKFSNSALSLRTKKLECILSK